MLAFGIFVQFSVLHRAWEMVRTVVLIAGTAFAAVIAHFVAINISTNNEVKHGQSDSLAVKTPEVESERHNQDE